MLIGTILVIFFLSDVNYIKGWSYLCNSEKSECKRTIDGTSLYPTLETCLFFCGKSSIVWPKPIQLDLSKEVIKFNKEVKFTNKASGEAYNFLQSSITYFNNNIQYNRLHGCKATGYTVSITLNPSSNQIALDWDTDESYNLTITKNSLELNVLISGQTVFGIRHGLETLLQLIIPYPENGNVCFIITQKATIIDKPFYKHRGLLLDSSRNFLSLNTIKTHINGLAASKMNTLHWHVTDSQSFPLEITSLPNMTRYGAYSEEKIYHTQDVKELVEYAKLRGVRLLFEIDGPSHSGSGWEWGNEAGLGNLAVCINAQPWRSFCIEPPCGQLNPANQQLYPVLQKLFADIKQLGNVDIFHMGGDELFIPCWNSTQEIIVYIGDQPRTEETFLNLWGDHQNKVLKAFDAAVGNTKNNLIVWSSTLTDPTIITNYLSPNRYTIQTWVPGENSLPQDLLNLGYKLIISTKDAWYLDHGFWGTTQFYNWQKVYDNVILTQNGVLGGEVCMWGEYVDDNNVLTRVWPRAAAAAERLWTNPDTSSSQAQYGFYLHRERLIDRGVNCDGITPRFCIQNEGDCV